LGDTPAARSGTLHFHLRPRQPLVQLLQHVPQQAKEFLQPAGDLVAVVRPFTARTWRALLCHPSRIPPPALPDCGPAGGMYFSDPPRRPGRAAARTGQEPHPHLGEETRLMGRKYLGRHLCIITKDAQAKKSNNGVIVIAHGRQRPTGTKFTLEGGTVYFYCPDGDGLHTNEYEFLKHWAGNKSYSAVLSDGTKKCRDYALSKSISYHGDANAKALGKKGIDELVRDKPDEAEDRAMLNYEAIESLVTSGRCPYDVVLIRNRKVSGGTTLSNVLKTLKQEGYGYGEVHCCFCRAGDKPRPWRVAAKEYA
jgi:hypothetical protein